MSASPDGSAETVLFDSTELLPETWQKFAVKGPVRAFNPGLLRDRDGWIFAYRIVADDGLRRIAICRLDQALGVIGGSQLALTDLVRFRPGAVYPEIATRWFADPRLYRLGGRLFIYWNSGWHEPHNCQFLQELDAVTLRPIAHPRELLLRGERRKLEKNWTFFEPAAGRFHAIYSITPHRVLEFSLAGDGDIVGEETALTEWSIEGYPANHGGLRGGSPPVLADGAWWSFCHSVHDGADGYRYAPAAYAFSAQAPFAPVARPKAPLNLGGGFGAKRTYAKLNAAVGEVIYPCGAERDGARWLVSHGINDETCAISTVSHETVLAAVERVPAEN